MKKAILVLVWLSQFSIAFAQKEFHAYLEIEFYDFANGTWIASETSPTTRRWISDTLYMELKERKELGFPFTLINKSSHKAMRCFPQQRIALVFDTAEPTVQSIEYSRRANPRRRIEHFPEDTLTILGYRCTRYRFSYPEFTAFEIAVDTWVADELRMPSIGMAFPEVDSFTGAYPTTHFPSPCFIETGLVALGHDGYNNGVLKAQSRAVRIEPLTNELFIEEGFATALNEVLTQYRKETGTRERDRQLTFQSFEAIERSLLEQRNR